MNPIVPLLVSAAGILVMIVSLLDYIFNVGGADIPVFVIGAVLLAAGHILSAEVIAYDELGCESVKRFVFSEMPLWVGIDCRGNSIFAKR